MRILGYIQSAIGGICTEDKEDLIELKKKLESVLGDGYYDGDGDELIQAAINMINIELNRKN